MPTTDSYYDRKTKLPLFSSKRILVNIAAYFVEAFAVPTRSEGIQTYLRAKDENRPHLMKLVFAETAKLEMTVETGAISFPPLTSGVDAITQVGAMSEKCSLTLTFRKA
jgi:hypothetical protein